MAEPGNKDRDIADAQPSSPPHYSAEDIRGGDIILRTRARRLIFIAGLAGILLLVILVRLFS